MVKYPVILSDVEREALWRIVHEQLVLHQGHGHTDPHIEVAGFLVPLASLLDRLARPDKDERLWWKR